MTKTLKLKYIRSLHEYIYIHIYIYIYIYIYTVYILYIYIYIYIFFFLNEINTFMQQQCNKLIKGDSKDIYIVTKIFIFQINAVLLNFQFIKEF